jgi:hypothetical protein
MQTTEIYTHDVRNKTPSTQLWMQYILEKSLVKQINIFQQYLTQQWLFTAAGSNGKIFVQQVC